MKVKLHIAKSRITLLISSSYYWCCRCFYALRAICCRHCLLLHIFAASKRLRLALEDDYATPSLLIYLTLADRMSISFDDRWHVADIFTSLSIFAGSYLPYRKKFASLINRHMRISLISAWSCALSIFIFRSFHCRITSYHRFCFRLYTFISLLPSSGSCCWEKHWHYLYHCLEAACDFWRAYFIHSLFWAIFKSYAVWKPYI